MNWEDRLLQLLRNWGIPGFRSGKPWKRILATFGYVLIAWWLYEGLTGAVPTDTYLAIGCLVVVLLVATAGHIGNAALVQRIIAAAGRVAHDNNARQPDMPNAPDLHMCRHCHAVLEGWAAYSAHMWGRHYDPGPYA